jgi:flagellar P-ring protein precursor FlgI
LNRTGDGTKSLFTIQSIVNMLERFGLNVDARQIKPKNAAAVMVTADLSSFAKKGFRVDVAVSSISDATSLEGGLLLMTPLLGADGQVYVQAQGPLSIGGMNTSAGGASVSINHALVGRIPAGGIVMQEIPSAFKMDGRITFLLRNPDFTTASRIASVINQQFADNIAQVIDGGTVMAKINNLPSGPLSASEFIAQAETLTIQPDVPARVVINERTGTVVVGKNVKLSAVAISHGNLSISITPVTQVSQPPPLTAGETVTTTTAQIQVESPEAHLMVMEDTPDVGAVAKALNSLGVTSRDIIAIFQALKQSGALNAELIII